MMKEKLLEWESWEEDNFDNIVQWTVEYDVKPGWKLITFTLQDKSKHKFEIEL